MEFIEMKLLLNDKELTHFLISQLDLMSVCKEVWFSEESVGQVRTYIMYEKMKRKFDIKKMREKFKAKIKSAVERDLKDYRKRVNVHLDQTKEMYFNKIHKNLDYFLMKLGEEKVIEQYKNSQKQNFVKSVGFNLSSSATMVRRKAFTDHTEECLIRNTVGNEQLLISKIDNNYPFWFIDSGYTNFLEPNKKWHRLVHNHLHHGNNIDAPVDRLGNFASFPRQWRHSGEKILVIEPGPFAASIFHVDIKTWKYSIEAELRQYTDKPIVFREKINKKTRENLFKHLNDEDYYCLVNINSNAATESIWAGIPVITLDKHITNPVTRSKISDINNLHRPNLANWLCMLSYSQFTFEELIDGTAGKLIKRYHG